MDQHQHPGVTPGSTPASTAEQHWSGSPPEPRPYAPPLQRERKGGGGSVSRALVWGLGALLVFSGLFVAFAAGMVVERAILTDDAEAADGGAPETFDRAWELVETHYVDPSVIDEENMLEAAIDGMLRTLQDEGHTRYLTPEEAHAETQSLSGAYVGVGIQVEDRDERIVVVAPLDNSPAKEAGVKPGDILLSVDGRDITGQTVADVIPSIRGEVGTSVTLTFEREGEPQPLEFTLTRREIDISSVSWTMLDNGIADIRLSQFTSGSDVDMAAALNAAKEAGATGIILDLRNNPGGYVIEATNIGSMFVPEGSTIYISQVRDGSRTPHVATPQAAHIGDLPLVVLINEGSASSSEIVSGAIKANNPNATVIGEVTFGTGTVLSSFPLGDDSSLLLGTELWLTPEGELIKNQGIRPDVVVGQPEGQTPFVPTNGVEPDLEAIEDSQLEWAIDSIESGQTGAEGPTRLTSPGRELGAGERTLGYA